VIAFSVVGIPAPQGSKRLVTSRGGKTLMIEANDARKRTWRGDIADAIVRWKQARPGDAALCPLDGALRVEVMFYLPRPKSISVRKRPFPNVKPDVDKQARSVLDALTINRVIVDDAQVVDLFVRKRYADYETVGAIVKVCHMPLGETP
jgi:Holliday junction resolvase RusA-like endonuclease